MLGNIGAGRREGASPVAGSALSCPASRALSARSSWKTYAREFARHVRATRGRALSHDVAPTAISLPRFRTCRVTARHSKMARDGRGIESVMTATAERAKGRQWAENSPVDATRKTRDVFLFLYFVQGRGRSLWPSEAVTRCFVSFRPPLSLLPRLSLKQPQ